MNRLFVPVSGRYDQNCEQTLSDLRKIGVERVYIAIEERFPFEKGARRDRVLSDLAEKVRFYSEAGLEVGVWIDTLGYGGAMPSYNKEAAKNYTRIRSILGAEQDDALCPSDPNFAEMMCELIRDIVAKSGAKMLMLDDELCLSVRPGIGCACQRHLAELEKRLGEKITLSELPKKIFMGAPSRYRSTWLGLMRDTLLDFCRKVRAAVDTVSEDIRIGFCSGYTSWDLEGADAVEIAEALAGKNKPFLRFTGAPYWVSSRRFERQSLQTIVECTRMQYAMCRDMDMEIFTEADTYPRDRFNTPAALSECFDIATRVSDGMDALKYMYEYSNQPTYDRGYLTRHEENMPLYAEISKAFDSKTAVGVRVWDRVRKFEEADLPVITDRPFTEADERRIENLIFSPGASMLTSLAIPTVYEGDGCLGIAFGEGARGVTEDNLGRGMILDAKGAQILEKSGIDTGLAKMELIPTNHLAKFPSGEDMLIFNSPTVARMELRPGTEILSRFYTFEQYSIDWIPGAYRYENSKGQRFLVFGFSAEDQPDHSSLLRSYQHGKIIEENAAWLSGSDLPATCPGHPMLYCICKADEKEIAAAYLNIHPDRIKGASVRFGEDICDAAFINCTGKQISRREVTIDDIPAFGFAFVTAKRV